MSALDFTGRVAVITGAGRGIGRAYARELASRGAAVVVNDPGVAMDGTGNDPSVARTVVKEILAAGGQAVPSVETVSTADGALGIVQTALNSYGRLDIVINNAGVFFDLKPIEEVSVEEFRQTWQVHVIGTVNVVQAAWPHMAAAAYGRIINTTSLSALVGQARQHSYSAAKGAICALTRSLALEGADVGIAVNAIAPGALTRPLLAYPDLPEVLRSGALSELLVSPTAAYLAHESCRLSGEILGAQAGRTTRFVYAETGGAFALEPTAEKIADDIDEILAETSLRRAGLMRGKDVVTRSADLVDGYVTAKTAQAADLHAT